MGGKDLPAPPRPKTPLPKVPFDGVSKEEEDKWIKEYEKWKTENSHIPNLQPPSTFLNRPRPKYDPPKLPPPNATDDVTKEWKEKYNKWKEDNSHLPNLQDADAILQRFVQVQQPQVSPVNTQGLEKRVEDIEQKLDKLMNHLGVK